MLLLISLTHPNSIMVDIQTFIFIHVVTKCLGGLYIYPVFSRTQPSSWISCFSLVRQRIWNSKYFSAWKNLSHFLLSGSIIFRQSIWPLVTCSLNCIDSDNPLKSSAIRRVIFKIVQCHPGLTYIFNFWHSGTVALRAECQSARTSENKNVG